jgi:hypothetical protein
MRIRQLDNDHAGLNGSVKTSAFRPISLEAFQQSLKQLGERWGSHRKADLGLRHQTGMVLNQRLGPPTERQRHRKKVLKQAAKHLGIAESELSRMRWFAHLFKNLKDLQRRYPKVTSWTEVRGLLVSLKPNKRRERQAPETRDKPASLKKVCRLGDQLCAELRQVQFALADTERSQIEQLFKELASAVPRRAGIRVSFSVSCVRKAT